MKNKVVCHGKSRSNPQEMVLNSLVTLGYQSGVVLGCGVQDCGSRVSV